MTSSCWLESTVRKNWSFKDWDASPGPKSLQILVWHYYTSYQIRWRRHVAVHYLVQSISNGTRYIRALSVTYLPGTMVEYAHSVILMNFSKIMLGLEWCCLLRTMQKTRTSKLKGQWYVIILIEGNRSEPGQMTLNRQLSMLSSASLS
jgi:hypothetical protein